MITYEQIKPYIEKKLISEQVHPENPNVRIFNYTQSCQFSAAWDEVTLQCRGLIMDISTGEILARPFEKFFNYQELLVKGTKIPKEDAIITEKFDGSLGILYWFNDQPWIATLFMRKSDDRREDSEVKKEIYENYFKKYNIHKVFDDRPRIVRLWQELLGKEKVIDVGDGIEF